jgi:hypothetical protein
MVSPEAGFGKSSENPEMKITVRKKNKIFFIPVLVV